MTRALNICRITDAFPPPWTGLNPGPYELSRAQAAQGHGVRVIAKRAAGSEAVDRDSGFEVHRVGGRSYLHELFGVRRFAALNRAAGFDLVHAHGVSAFLFQLLARRRFGVPVFLSVHSVRRRQYALLRERGVMAPGLPERLELIRERACFRRADVLLPVSEGLRDELVEEYGIEANRVRVIGNGVSPDFWTGDSPSANDPPGVRPRAALVFVGVLNGRKDPGPVLEAMPAVARQVPEVQLVIVGRGPWKAKYQAQAERLGLGELAVFHDVLEPRALASLYRRARAFLLPSLYEGLPKVLLEAMAAGLPVAGSAVPGISEMIQHGVNGLLLPPGAGAAEWREALTRLLEDRALRQSAAEGSPALIRRDYTWERVAERCYTAYRHHLAAQQQGSIIR